MQILPDPECPHCHGTGVIEGRVHEVIPDQPGAAWWKNSDRACECTAVWEDPEHVYLPVLSAATLQRFFAELEDFLLTSGP